MVSPPQVGDVIRIRSWHGVVLDVFTDEAGKPILRVQTVRNIFHRLNPEFCRVRFSATRYFPSHCSLFRG